MVIHVNAQSGTQPSAGFWNKGLVVPLILRCVLCLRQKGVFDCHRRLTGVANRNSLDNRTTRSMPGLAMYSRQTAYPLPETTPLVLERRSESASRHGMSSRCLLHANAYECSECNNSYLPQLRCLGCACTFVFGDDICRS